MTHNPAVNTDLAHKAAQGRLPPLQGHPREVNKTFPSGFH